MEKETYLTFFLGTESFAVNVKCVLEVLQHQYITKVPKTPEHILGIINFRGDILPVIDSRRKFNLLQQSDDSKNIVIVFEIMQGEQKTTIAATADSVKDVIEIDPEEIRPVPEMGINYNSKYIQGVIRRDDTFIMMLEIEKFFSDIDLQAKEILSELKQNIVNQ